MGKALVSSKGQVTIPIEFRRKMSLAARREVFISQQADGTVLIKPVRSMMELAGVLRGKTKLLSVADEKREANEQRSADLTRKHRGRHDGGRQGNAK